MYNIILYLHADLQVCVLYPVKVFNALDEADASSRVEGTEKIFKESEHLFSGLETHYQQLQYCKTHLNFIVSVNRL